MCPHTFFIALRECVHATEFSCNDVAVYLSSYGTSATATATAVAAAAAAAANIHFTFYPIFFFPFSPFHSVRFTLLLQFVIYIYMLKNTSHLHYSD